MNKFTLVGNVEYTGKATVKNQYGEQFEAEIKFTGSGIEKTENEYSVEVVTTDGKPKFETIIFSDEVTQKPNVWTILGDVTYVGDAKVKSAEGNEYDAKLSFNGTGLFIDGGKANVQTASWDMAILN